jgi:transglutaminase-like putative cysteine protease
MIEMDRTISSMLKICVETPARLALQVGLAHPSRYSTVETTVITCDGAPVSWSEVPTQHGGRLWLLDSPQGAIQCDYRALLTGVSPGADAAVGDQLLYLRPSRFCESDRLTGFAARQFRNITAPLDILAAVSSWVGTQLQYIPGSSGPTDGAVDTLLAGRGVCRDFAHLAIALLRALEIPARMVAVYAPGLLPMDFHAVVEACVDDSWYVTDPTLLAPRTSLVRIATGRDAADTAFLSSYGGVVRLDSVTVTATTTGDLPTDNVHELLFLK